MQGKWSLQGGGDEGAWLAFIFLGSVTDEATPKNIEMCLFERKTVGRNLVRNADKITENNADFIIAVVLLNPEELV